MSSSQDELQDALATILLANLGAFQSFARRRLGDTELAADAVQESLLRALRVEQSLAHDQNLLAWFYRILRNVITDLHRRQGSRTAALERFAREVETEAAEDGDLERFACSCFRELLPTLRPEYAEVLQLSDLDGKSSEAVAEQLGITRNNLKVRLHRARLQLRQRLEQTCQLCARHGCLDCTCAPQEEAK